MSLSKQPRQASVYHMDNDIMTTDQRAANEGAFERRAQRVAAVFLAIMAILGFYALLAAAGVVPAAPWSPLGQ